MYYTNLTLLYEANHSEINHITLDHIVVMVQFILKRSHIQGILRISETAC